ncbi:hypothetical protein NU688_32865 [Variovorax sp. ZS18.2.2]|uniref:hypothetical protein n=1 Tax=Variovorax sp. ZS18.2.2 TaxID=2971255 RepID=UPI0021511D9A|nr:hypothetical protein [Variovorax sp. ZS18.2.2]MCR6480989.1 hypothetical protein [Variovorax sp. ZS18.2.2]
MQAMKLCPRQIISTRDRMFDVSSDGRARWRDESDLHNLTKLGRGLREILGPIESARWWMYRHAREQYLALDIWGEKDSVGITLRLCGRTLIDLDPRVDVQFEVVDLSDACHLVHALLVAVASMPESGTAHALRLGAAVHSRAGDLAMPVARDRAVGPGSESKSNPDTLFEVGSSGDVSYSCTKAVALVLAMGVDIRAQVGALVSARWWTVPAQSEPSTAAAANEIEDGIGDLAVVLEIQGERGAWTSRFRIPRDSGVSGNSQMPIDAQSMLSPCLLHDATDAFYLMPQLVRHLAGDDRCPLPLAFAPQLLRPA